MDRKPKTVFQLDSPFTATQWPQISSENQDTILEVLCSLLSPIGQHRSNHVENSKGKRSKKRKRQEAKAEAPPAIAAPPTPEISSFLAVGLNSITRTLESSSQKSRPKIRIPEESGDSAVPEIHKAAKQDSRENANHSPLEGNFSAIFVCRSSQSSILHDHLPQLVYTASLAYPNQSTTRLIELPKGSEARLAEALCIPRVSSIGILEGAPHSQALIDLVRENVPEIEIPWLQQAKESKYLPVKINAIETSHTVVKKAKA